MAESVKPRLAVDLDEIERQLAYSHQAQAPAAPRGDPLAELARIVGQDDPFHSMLASDRRPTPKSRESAGDDLFVLANDRGPQPHAAPELRGSSYDPRRAADLDEAYADQAQRYEGYAPQPQPQTGYSQDSYAQGGYPDPSEFEQADDQASGPAAPKRNTRKSLMAVGAVLGAAVLGVGGALMLRGPTATTRGDAPLVKAANEPTKVQPQSPGGVEIPNQNKQIYERAGQEGQTKVVNREEQPIDVRQATRTASADPTAPVAAPASASSPAGSGLALGEPRKVRTISIRPDGTVILPDSAPAAGPKPVQANSPAAQSAVASSGETPQSRSAAATPTTPPARPAVATPATSGGSSSQALAAPAPQPVAQAAPQRAPAMPPAVATPQPAAQPAPVRVAAAQPVPAAAQPAPAAAPAPPAAQPAPQRVASVQPTAMAAPQPTETVGGYAVQLGVSQSEADAKSTLQRLQGKFSDLSGKSPLIRKAEVNGSTVYRVRVGPMSREDASSLCSKLQGQGGECYVAKN